MEITNYKIVTKKIKRYPKKNSKTHKLNIKNKRSLSPKKITNKKCERKKEGFPDGSLTGQ